MPLCGKIQNANLCCQVLDSIADGVFVVDRDRRIISYFNQAAERITGFSAEQAIGQCCFDILRSDLCQTDCPVEQALKSEQPIKERTATLLNRANRRVAACLSVTLIRDDSGAVVGAVEIFRDCTREEDLRRAVEGTYSFGELISKNARMQELFEILPDVAESSSTVLIQGASGSGKSLLARSIHELSPRRRGPFVKVNCGAVPDSLLESELFGYRKGAFTDARRDKPGRFQLAHGGSLFLDEIACTSPALQVKLLRFIEDKQFVPLGATVPVTADVRILAAANIDLEDLVQAGSFRADLFYRLNVISVRLPPLLERREDIPMLVVAMLRKLNAVTGKDINELSRPAMGVLMNHDYPGNVRELENIIEHAHVLCRGCVIEVTHLPVELVHRVRMRQPAANAPGPLQSSEEHTIRAMLKKHSGQRGQVANDLGISRATLWRKMKRYGIQ